MTIQIVAPATNVAWSPPLALAKGARIELVLVRGDGETLPAAGYVDVQFARESGDWATVAGLSANVPRLLVEGPVSMRVGRRGETSAPLGVEYLDLAAAGGGSSTGGATEATLGTRASEATLAALAAKVPALAAGGRTPVDGSGVTQPVSAANLPLPTGAATEASLIARLTEATFAAFSAVFGAQSDASAGSSGGTFSHMSFMKRLALYLDIIQGKLPGSLGAKAGAASLSIVPATDAGLAMGAQLPSALGPQSNTASLSVVPANFASASVASVAASTASQALLAASTTRMGAIIFNNSTGILYMRLGQSVSIGGHSLRLMPYESLVLEAADYRGSIFGIWDVANGNALVTQMSA